jgi:hypothetical protein
MSTLSAVTYQASDLSRNYRSILNSARQEDTLIRDTDGETLILLSLDRAQRDRTMAGLLSDFTRLLRAYSVGDESGVVNSGSFSFASLLSVDMRRALIDELYNALQIAQSGGALESVHDIIEDWIVTAQIWSNEELRDEVLEVDENPPADVLI